MGISQIFPVFCFCMAALTPAILSRRGWHPLAQRFRTQGRPEGRIFSKSAADIGSARYSGCLYIVVAEEGLYLENTLPFNYADPPILIPWNSFGPVEPHQKWPKYVTQVQVSGDKTMICKFPEPLGPIIQKRIVSHSN